ncbi:YggS family pyridoxal phosphate-dependent enzyme [Exiguobacterium sp. TBG-PICH-001]|uniref:YggS family pyridoxal phosphate-dependent enzyme n=1 Tax=Exiguobacterium abrahamii TaxID=2785532 RepID=UPI0018A7B102|nr:YggS family pyridoxal phosphate-dependent enzyme [Exiguobacterium sp. TBG-PICH-001]MBF8152471.1 YggS family pyridoxal phosphate-dependent enzyme [Exiguobacterium sp. TBG-PICH-001]
MSILDNVQEVTKRMELASEKSSSEKQVQLIGVTKSVSSQVASELLAAGVTHLGENRPDGLLEKQAELGRTACTWHFIGTLQTRKVRQVIDAIDVLHSLDRLHLAEEINKRTDRIIDCFIQVNVSGEESKQGIAPEDLPSFLHEIGQYPAIRVIGLMTMAPLTEDTTRIREVFQSLKTLQEEVKAKKLSYAPCTELSMGMSSDFEIAIEEGATFVRIGTTLVHT